MIKSKRGKVTLKGTKVNVLADYLIITHTIFNDLKEDLTEEAVVKILKKILEAGLKDTESIVNGEAFREALRDE